jgi:ABC-type nitrate/sulfonate/bicarbonate transport system substrate-binding protein
MKMKMKMKMRAPRALSMVAAAMVWTLVACGTASPAGESSPAPLQRVKALWVAKVANMAPALVALDAGYFKEQGLDLDLSYVNGSPTGMAALVSGEIDFLQVAGTAVVTAASSTQESAKKPVLIIGTVNQSVWKLMVQKDITAVSQLKGKTLCITRAGTADEIALKLFLKRVNLDPSRDVTILPGGSIEACVATVSSNRAAGGIFSTPMTAILESRGYKVLVDFAKENIQLQQLGVAVTKGYADAHPDTVLRFTKAYIQGIHRFKTDQAFAVQTLSKYLGITDKPQLDDAFNTYKDIFETVPLPTDAALQNVIDTVPQAKGLAPAAFVEPRFVKQLEREGFIRKVYGQK